MRIHGKEFTAWGWASGGALAVVAVVAAIFLHRSAPQPGPAVSAAQPATAVSAAAVGGACPDRLTPALLPKWARTGFSDPEPRAPYATSAGGHLVAILFTDGLYAPPKPDQGNKILWVSPITGGPLRISARLGQTGDAVTREVPGGPGPSIVDLPAPGCWHLTLHWGTASDTIDLRYLPATPAGS